MFGESWTLTTGRLQLRVARGDDLPFAASVWTDARVRKYLGGVIDGEKAARRILPRIEARELIVVSTLDRNQPIGVVIVAASAHQQLELSYLFDPQHWNKGCATEALSALLLALRSSRANYTLTATTQVANAPSRKLLARLGFHEAHERIEFDAPQITCRLQL